MSGTRKNKGSLVFLVLLVLCLAGSLAAMQVLGQKAKDKDPVTVAKPPEPESPAVGAFAQGGSPSSSGPARAVFEVALPDFVIALDQWGRSGGQAQSIAGDMQSARGALIGAARTAGLSDTAITRLEELIAACYVAASVDEAGLDGAADEMMKRTLSFNDALASAGLGFFVDADLLTHRSGTRSVLLFSFAIQRVVLYRSGGHDVRTLRVRRLDPLNWSYSLLGFTAPQRRDAVVLDNKVDEHLLELLPALAEETRMDPFYLSLEDSYTPWFTETRNLATSIIREELGAAGDEDLQTLGSLLARRLEIYKGWNELLEAREMSINPPKTLAITWDYRRQMEGLVTHGAMDELDEIQEKLASKSMRVAYEKVHDHFAQSVERHEAQHRLDLAELYTLPMPEELEHYVGELPDGYRGQAGLASRSLAEMSAYLSELARDPITPRLNLSLLTGYLLSKRAWGMGESYAALVIVAGLADELGIEHEDFVVSRSIQRGAVAATYQALCAVSTERMRSASASLWQRFFGRPLPELQLIAR